MAIETLLTIDEHGSKIARNNVFHCHLSRQMAIKNSVSKILVVDSMNVFDCQLSAVSIPINEIPQIFAKWFTEKHLAPLSTLYAKLFSNYTLFGQQMAIENSVSNNL